MEPRRNKTIVAFFAGTGANFMMHSPGYVTQQALGVKQVALEHGSVDQSFQFINDQLATNQERYGYDGCHQRGGGVFAYGIEQPVEHLYQKIKAELGKAKGENKDENQKITLVLTAHSRGCLSALLLAKKLYDDKILRTRVDVVLDFRDPVPGNFALTTATPLVKLATMTHQLSDLRECTNIKSAHITVLEKGIFDYAFDVLVPHFSPTTKLEVEYLPGIHDIQERNAKGLDFRFDAKKGCLLSSPTIHLLGIIESIKSYAKNGVDINYAHFLADFGDNIEKIQSFRRENFEAIKQLIASLHGTQINKDQFISFLEKTQLFLYDQVMIYCNSLSQRIPHFKIQSRRLHYGGEFQAVGKAALVTHLNMQHALLAEKHGHIPPGASIYLDFKGGRLDLSQNQRVTQALQALRNECRRYYNELTTKSTDFTSEGFCAVNDLCKLFKNDPCPLTLEAKKKILENFIDCFNRRKHLFYDSPDIKAQRFCNNISFILAGLLTLGIYAGVRAYNSKVNRGSAKFWKSDGEIFHAKLDESLSLYKKK